MSHLRPERFSLTRPSKLRRLQQPTPSLASQPNCLPILTSAPRLASCFLLDLFSYWPSGRAENERTKTSTASRAQRGEHDARDPSPRLVNNFFSLTTALNLLPAPRVCRAVYRVQHLFHHNCIIEVWMERLPSSKGDEEITKSGYKRVLVT
jgi:hypothetical protein